MLRSGTSAASAALSRKFSSVLRCGGFIVELLKAVLRFFLIFKFDSFLYFFLKRQNGQSLFTDCFEEG